MIKYEVVQSENRVAKKYYSLIKELESHIKIMKANDMNIRVKRKLAINLLLFRKQFEHIPRDEKNEKIKQDYSEGQKNGKMLTVLKEELAKKYKVSVSQVKKLVYED